MFIKYFLNGLGQGIFSSPSVNTYLCRCCYQPYCCALRGNGKTPQCKQPSQVVNVLSSPKLCIYCSSRESKDHLKWVRKVSAFCNFDFFLLPNFDISITPFWCMYFKIHIQNREMETQPVVPLNKWAVAVIDCIKIDHIWARLAYAKLPSY